MRIIKAAFLLFVFSFISVFSGSVLAGPRIIKIQALNQTFLPSTITASPGEVVILKITSAKDEKADKDGFVHSWSIKELDIDVKLKVGTTQFKFVVPDKPGTYKIECLVECGKHHENMTGELVVK